MKMDIQAEKLQLIEQVLKLENTDMIDQIKELLDQFASNDVAGSEPNGHIITQTDLIERAKASDEAIRSGDLVSIDELERESESW